jgi:hypothetical protein
MVLWKILIILLFLTCHHGDYSGNTILSHCVNSLVNWYCFSSRSGVLVLDYSSIIVDKDAKAFISHL